jgi:glutaredoxin-related protein
VAKRVPFEELDLADPVEGRAWRARMLEAANLPPGPPVLPQLHAQGRYVGGGDDVQELEDFGELDAALRGEVIAVPTGA